MRDLVKTMTYASLHFTVGFAVTYALTGQLAIAAGVALIEPSVNTVVFFFHEKVWAKTLNLFPFGHTHGHGHGAGPVPAA